MLPKSDLRFYIGLHRPTLAKHFEACFININILRGRKSDFLVNDWIMDSGAFTELLRFGRYIHPVAEYANEIERWSQCGNMEMAVCQDYMCEPLILDRTGLTIQHHQELTVERYDALKPSTSVLVMPVLQGYAPRDYVRHLTMYGDRLEYEARVGVGSICKRNSKPQEIIDILEAIKSMRPDLRLHGFGVKITALSNAYICSLLSSADSMAWSYRARRNGRNANGLEEAKQFYHQVTNNQAKKPYQHHFPKKVNKTIDKHRGSVVGLG